MKNQKWYFSFIVLVVSVFLMSSCGGDSESGGSSTSSSFKALYASVFAEANGENSCANSRCHTSHKDDSGLDFSSENSAYLALTQNNGQGVGCETEKIVVPGDPSASILYASLDLGAQSKLEARGCVVKYNVHEQLNLSSSSKNAIQSWIASGAAR